MSEIALQCTPGTKRRRRTRVNKRLSEACNCELVPRRARSSKPSSPPSLPRPLHHHIPHSPAVSRAALLPTGGLWPQPSLPLVNNQACRNPKGHRYKETKASELCAEENETSIIL
ncbi:hypothetical protein E2C01_037362 [Portunus trituberculatus]|uniref:Uncharacterized protein n=1 Tax=Portunus trituberculatus TaxID=210409 RepID=A0A5B7F7Y0_PORTR|nr:hypothetical protein [Portunus trituberculatus]